MTQFTPGKENPKAIDRAKRIASLKAKIESHSEGVSKENLSNAWDLLGIVSRARFNEYVKVLKGVGAIEEKDGKLIALPIV